MISAATCEIESMVNAPIRLRALAGGEVPEEQLAASQRAERLSTRARAALTELLRPTVMGPMNQALAEQLSGFCLRHEIAEADLGHLLKICRWLLNQAASADLTPDALEEDIQLLWKSPGPLRDVLLSTYEHVKPTLRARLVGEALIQHGNILNDIDWRIDQLRSDRHAHRLDVPIAVVTLSHQTADTKGRLTLQLTVADLQRLAGTFAALAQKTQLAADASIGEREP